MGRKWLNDPQYSHGFLVPLFSAYLLYRGHQTSADWFSRPLPVVGGLVLVWLVLRRNKSRNAEYTEQKTDDVYEEEERRRREGTDKL